MVFNMASISCSRNVMSPVHWTTKWVFYRSQNIGIRLLFWKLFSGKICKFAIFFWDLSSLECWLDRRSMFKNHTVTGWTWKKWCYTHYVVYLPFLIYLILPFIWFFPPYLSLPFFVPLVEIWILKFKSLVKRSPITATIRLRFAFCLTYSLINHIMLPFRGLIFVNLTYIT